jgi:hypothetical protein
MHTCIMLATSLYMYFEVYIITISDILFSYFSLHGIITNHCIQFLIIKKTVKVCPNVSVCIYENTEEVLFSWIWIKAVLGSHSWP